MRLSKYETKITDHAVRQVYSGVPIRDNSKLIGRRRNNSNALGKFYLADDYWTGGIYSFCSQKRKFTVFLRLLPYAEYCQNQCLVATPLVNDRIDRLQGIVAL